MVVRKNPIAQKIVSLRMDLKINWSSAAAQRLTRHVAEEVNGKQS